MAGPAAAILIQTLRDPQATARWLIAQDVPMAARWMAALLAAILSMIGLMLAVLISPETEPSIFTALADPWFGLPVQFTSILLLSVVVTVAGRVQGGQGRFADALLLVSWLELVMAIAQALQIVALVILPPLSALISMASLVLFLWLMVHFTAALHGIAALGRVLLALVAGFVAVVVLVAIVAGILGLVPQPTGP